MTAPRPTPRPLDTPEQERALDRYYMLGLACMLALIVAFPIYKLGEPARRAHALEAMRAENIAIGATMFAQHCAACHGDDARGGRGFPTLGAKEFLTSVSDKQLHWLISGGIPGSAMVAYDLDLGGPFTSQEISRVVTYLRSLEEGAPSVSGWYRGEQAPARVVATADALPQAAASASAEAAAESSASSSSAAASGVPTDSVAVRAVADAETERVYASRCAACHGASGEGTPIAPAVRPLSAALQANPDSVYTIIARGVAGTAMLPFAKDRGGALDGTTIRALAVWLRGAPGDAPR